MQPKSDPQRPGLYWMEAEFNGWWDYALTGRGRLIELAEKVCRYYKIDTPLILFSRRESKHQADYCHGEITVYTKANGHNPGVLIHELAHHITDEFYDDVQPHGPEFVAIYMHLLDHFCFLPNKEFRRLAKKYRVKIGRRYRPRAFRNGRRRGA